LSGGPRTQILNLRTALEKLGAQVSLFDSWAQVDKEQIDLFHLFAANVGTYHLALQARNQGLKLVISPIFFTRHSVTMLSILSLLERAVGRIKKGVWSEHLFASEICQWAELVIPNTKMEAHYLSRGLGVPLGKIIVVPNGVEARFAYAKPDLFVEKYQVRDFILNVGHIGPPRKNVLNLIRALATIDRPAVIIGQVTRTPYADACLAEARKNKNITIIPGLSNDTPLLASAYAACDIFALPSWYETPGIAALEAAVAGAKIVITPYGGTKEYFEDHAEYVEPRSVESIRRGILRSLDKKKDRVLATHIMNNFLWDTIALKTLQAYNTIRTGPAAP
jgi:glycosyltransferase involved in cell wall biosynthesis